MWRAISLYGNVFHLYIQDGEVKQVRSGSAHQRASVFAQLFPDLYRALIERLPKA